MKLPSKFRLAKPLIDHDLCTIISRELRRQKAVPSKLSSKRLKELGSIARNIEKSGLPHYLVKRSLPNGLGFGIFLHPDAKPLIKGQAIGAYSGEVVLMAQNQDIGSSYTFELVCDMYLTKEEQAVFDRKNSYHPKRHYSLSIDASKKGNFTRFINHSAKPNIIAELFSIPANSCGIAPSPIEVIYSVKKTVHPGEQLLVSYEGQGESYWGPLRIKPFPITPSTFTI